MNDQLEQALQCISELNAIARGLAMSLDSMMEDLSVDARYYAFKACVDAIVEKSDEAEDALDSYQLSLVREDEA